MVDWGCDCVCVWCWASSRPLGGCRSRSTASNLEEESELEGVTGEG